MNEQVWWYLARSSGIVALVLLVLSLTWGVLLATRVLKPHDRPAWILEVHKWLSGSAVVMTVLHLAGLYLDSYIEFTFADLLVPGASTWRPGAVAVGIVSMYAMFAVQATSYMRRWISKRAWRAVHMLSYLLTLGSAVHAGMSGTDVSSRWYQALVAVLMAGAVGAVVVRVLTPRRSRRSAEPTQPPAGILS